MRKLPWPEYRALSIQVPNSRRDGRKPTPKRSSSSPAELGIGRPGFLATTGSRERQHQRRRSWKRREDDRIGRQQSKWRVALQRIVKMNSNTNQGANSWRQVCILGVRVDVERGPVEEFAVVAQQLGVGQWRNRLLPRRIPVATKRKTLRYVNHQYLLATTLGRR